ncbi:hypothetical protein KW539_13580 [Vibrio fluvialis]|uniref:hypothetical protein n=1 Tax=Vibrio parahaemolyticus TaxID=670 RepID=UPI001C9BE015|nr:hypothetical protein [Vibrio parahaemolyticus]MBY8172165.1 hypothetical protein [Vibrio fluvialis]EJS4060552.1 hypothetical protein [Vibrio parahaemolyticus]MBY8236861.1 hypothetical protein [Vibrio fluvialis]MBY8241039.1 hypothetical protein [Vibrio fluvialis]HCG7962750.1 hypothetical protein [Vibrio parahaemolyticus]
MSNVMTKEIADALEWAQELKETADEFIDIADGINNDERIRLEEERDIDIDSKRWVPLDEIPLGEEELRVRDDRPILDNAIQTLKDLAEGKTPASEITEKLEEAMEDLDAVEGTLQDVGAEEVIKASQSSDDDFYHE